MDRILRIDMGAEGGPEFKDTPMEDYSGLAGRALTSALVSKEVPPNCHPLGKDNILVIAPGLLSGTAAAMSGRISIGCKSPLTGGIKEANAGGQPSQMLARLGYAAITLEGVSECTKALHTDYRYVVIEKESPFGIMVFKIEEEDLRLAQAQVREEMRTLTEAIKADSWPCYPDGTYPLRLPYWERTQWERKMMGQAIYDGDFIK